MSYKPKKWIFKTPDKSVVEKLSRELNISSILANILASRNISEPAKASTFINPSFLDLENPFLIPDMAPGVKRLRTAIDNKEKVLIYGDRDLDGISAVTVAYSTLKILGLEPLWYIPQDIGYGLHKEILERYIAQGVGLILTVDCGTSNWEEVAYAKSKGVDVIITDHHETPADGKIPQDAVAVINPKRKDSKYPFNNIAGCAVAMKLLHGVLMSYDRFFDKELIFLDIETSGLHPVFNEICEIAALKTKNFVVCDKFHTLINQAKDIPQAAINIHGITKGDCSSSANIGEALQKLVDFTGDSSIVTYNTEFVKGFLQQKLKPVLNKELHNTWIDIQHVAEEIVASENHKLGFLAESLDISQEQTHRALDDAFLIMRVFERLEKIQNKKIRFFLQDNLDIVSIGTIGDMMPLISENRVIVKHGLEAIRKTQKIGLKLMFERILADKYYNAKSISYNIVPLFNSCGRMKRADLAVEFLTAKDHMLAQQIFNEIMDINDSRKELQQENIKKFLELLKIQCDTEKDNLLFISGQDIEHGVTGIVASQIVRQYNKPAILLIIENGKATGTGRSIEGFNLYSALEECKSLFERFGGHSQAVGFTILTENIDDFKKHITTIANRQITPEMTESTISIDAAVKVLDITNKLVEDVSQLEPFGIENPIPVFIIQDAKVTKYFRMGIENRHLKMVIEQNGSIIDAVGWDMGRLAKDVLADNKFIDIAAQVEVNQFQNKEQVQLNVIDIRTAELPDN